MKAIRPRSFYLIIVLFTSALFVFSSCQEPPIVDFSYSPVVNCEAGEKISFADNSLDALYYSWDFGNGTYSDIKNPIIEYENAGSYDVTLTASNQTKSAISTQIVRINEPTVLSVYVISEDTNAPIKSCNIKVYENESDKNELIAELFYGLTNNLGYIEFSHLESQVYFVTALVEKNNGVFRAEGLTKTLTLNQSNILTLKCKSY